MKLRNKQNGLELTLDESLLTRLSEIGVDHFPNEFGGFLIGYYSDNFRELIVTDYIVPAKYKSYSFLFVRSAEGIADILKERFIRERKYYVGEWHTHPSGPTAFSDTDLRAMKEIVASKKVRIENPVLLIIGVDGTAIIDYKFYFYNGENLIPYE